MIRPLALSLTAGIALLAAPFCDAHEIFPVVHNEPISIRVLSGKKGEPLPHLHLLLIGGYDRNDLHDQLFREEALTDAQGVARLSNQLANLPWLQVWVNKKPLCQSNPRKSSFSIELIRRDGLSAPNLCGFATAENAPGLFNVFVKGEAERGKLAKILHLNNAAKIPAPTPAPLAPAATPALTPAATVASQPAPQQAAAAVGPALPVAAIPAPAAPAPPTTPPIQIVATHSAIVEAVVLPSSPVKAEAKIPAHHAAGKQAQRRAVSASHRATPAARRAKPIPVSCAVELPPVKAVRSKVSLAPPPAEKTDLSKLARARARALGTGPKSKPAAGVRLSAAEAGKTAAPAKKE